MIGLAGIVIMHVPGFSETRDANVAYLTEAYEAFAIEVAVARDPMKQGILLNYRQALHLAKKMFAQAPEAQWVIIQQDDAVPVRGWLQELPVALQNAPAPIVSLCHFSDKGAKAAAGGYAYTVHEHAVWGQAVAYRREALEGIARVAQDVHDMDYQRFRKWDDGLAAVHNLLTGGKSCFTSRAVFTHLEGKSTVGNVPGVHRHPAATIENTIGPSWEGRVKHSGAAVKPMLVDLAYELHAWREARG